MGKQKQNGKQQKKSSIKSDVLGSYTGRASDRAKPTQDADDL